MLAVVKSIERLVIFFSAVSLQIDSWLAGITSTSEIDSDGLMENLEENYHILEMFANADFTEAFMVDAFDIQL